MFKLIDKLKTNNLNSKALNSRGRLTSKRGYRDDLGFSVRSQMEHNILLSYYYIRDKYNRIEKVEYEVDSFKFEKNRWNIGGYIPDIKITSKTGGVFYVEVKGVVDSNCKRKALLMEKQYPDVIIFYITPKKYKLWYENFKDKVDWK